MAKMVEIDEAEYNQMVALRTVATKIVAKPESRKLLEQAQKLVDPNAATPMLDAEAAHLAPIKETETRLTAEIAALKKEREDEKREATLAAIADKQAKGFARLRGELRYTDEGVTAVKKLMEDKGILDVEDAVAIFERANPPPPPATPGGITGERWNFQDVPAEGGDKDIAALLANKGEGAASDAAAMRLANQALSEMRGSRR